MRELVEISRQLSAEVSEQTFGGSVAFVYNPLQYARESHELYLERCARRSARVLLVGMNPGPFGMAQTGVPFGDVTAVRDWIGVSAPVGRPPLEHPKRPVLGFDLKRREGSGKRLWGWAESKFSDANAFFDEVFVHNYCPLLFLHESGRNIVPEKLSKAERELLFEPCDRALAKIVAAIEPQVAIGVGKFAAGRIAKVVGDSGPAVDRILHPSPANPLANKDWAGQVEPVFRRYGLDV